MTPTTLSELFSLQGRVALITGASGGIGRVLAEGYAAAGATIALHGRSAEKLAQIQQDLAANGTQVESFSADLERSENVSVLVENVIQRFGRIDILVNCAGTNQRLPITEVTPEIYERILTTNLRAPYFLSKAVFPCMARQGGGKIINIGSMTTAIALSDISVYGLTKGAIAQMTKSMAVEWCDHNIQVNCLCPGFISTELTVPLWTNQRRKQWILDRLLVKRPGKPEDLVGLAIYLAAPASDYTTGQVMFVDGGFLAGGQW